MIQRILEQVAQHERVVQPLSKGGVLSLDRGLPFLLVYREPAGRDDAGTNRLVTSEAAYLTTREGEEEEAGALVRALAEAGSVAHGAYLVLEIWSSPDPDSRTFRVHAPEGPAPETVGTLVDELDSLAEIFPGLDVVVETGEQRQPPGMPQLLSVEESWQGEILLLGLEVPGIYRDRKTGEPYPRFLRKLQHRLSRILRRAIHEFVRVQTTTKVENPLALGTRTPPEAAWEVDRTLCLIERSFDLLLLTSPVNARQAWERFRSDGFARNPELHYRLLPVDPDLLKRRLFAIELETLDDPALADLFQEKRTELDTQFTMLGERGTPAFRYSSQRLYGVVDERLRSTAEALLAEVPPAAPSRGAWVDAAGFRIAAERELAFYRSRFPEIGNTVQIRRDVTGLMVSRGDLLIGEALRIRADRLAPLLQHEVGTHVLTYVNGSVQPLEQLSLGLAGYDEFQEGLAVLSEYLVGGLDRLRMRLLAARVLAACSVQEGGEFVDTHRLLTRDHGFSAEGAWQIALRVHASGGFLRDLIYLRGLLDLLEVLEGGTELQSLYIGKFARRHIPVLEELRHREVLREPPLTPRFLDDPAALERLDAIRNGVALTELICQRP